MAFDRHTVLNLHALLVNNPFADLPSRRSRLRGLVRQVLFGRRGSFLVFEPCR